MCGILGTINRSFGKDVLDVLYHRGPDDWGLTADIVGDHLVTVGHRRLSILDLSPAGHQPMWTGGRTHGIVFNGEIYNHAELRDEIPVIEYAGHSDTETILQYLSYRGIHSVARFNGIFALAFVDVLNQKLFLARDPFGIKPLYYWTDGTSFIFSSEIRAVRRMVDDPLDPANLAELLRLRYLPSPDTLFKNIRKVRPGHILEVDLRTRRFCLSEYSFLRAPSRQCSVMSPEEAVEQYGFLLEQAIKRQLMSDVEIGMFLSGGIDSALIASIAQRHASHRTKAFTVGFSGDHAADETADAQDTARIVGLDHHQVSMGFQEFLDVLPRVSAIVEEPLATASAIPMFYLSSLASKHVKVVLSGQGADEAMGGYRRYQGELLRSLVPGFSVPFLREAARRLRVRNDAVLRALDSMEGQDDVSRFESVYGVFSPAQIVHLIGHDASRATERIRYFFDLLQCSTEPESVQRMMRLDLRMNLADDLLLYTDKITMHHSIECRVPLLDLDLVQFIESLPRAYRLSMFRRKVIHKRFAKRLLPKSMVNRNKKGFCSPAGTWFRNSGYARDILLDQRSTFASYFDITEVAKVLDQHARGMDRERQIFLLLSVSSWMSGNREPIVTASPRQTAQLEMLPPLFRSSSMVS